MIEIKTVFKGEFTNRKTEQFRQVEKGVKRLLEVGVTEKRLDPEGTTNHEKAHIIGHIPGRGGRIVARVFVNKRNKIKGWEIQHEIDPLEKLSMSGKEMVKASLAPAFVKGRKCSPPSGIDLLNAAGGLMIIGLLKIAGKED